MKILVLSYFFPPYNCSGAVRVSKICKWLISLGHDIRVVTADGQILPPTLALDIPEKLVSYTSWKNVNFPIAKAIGGIDYVAQKGYEVKGPFSNGLKILGDSYKTVLNLPDGQIGWLPYAIAKGKELTRSWRPDVIFASAPPYTSLIAGSRISAKYRIPWVADLRDLWTDNPYYKYPIARRAIDTWLERKTLQSAAGCVVVSDHMAGLLSRKDDYQIKVVRNAFDPDDYRFNKMPQHNGHLNILHSGMLIAGHRDPSPLFEAMHLLGSKCKRVIVNFYGRYLNSVYQLAEKYEVSQQVRVHHHVAHAEIQRLQSISDILLLLLWADPKEIGVFTGKFFEYVGARRPILVIGRADNVASRMVCERKLGRVSLEPKSIANNLSDWLEEKDRLGAPLAPHHDAARGLSWPEQIGTLSKFLEHCAAKPNDKPSLNHID